MDIVKAFYLDCGGPIRCIGLWADAVAQARRALRSGAAEIATVRNFDGRALGSWERTASGRVVRRF